MMLVSVSAQASAKGLNEVSHSARVALQARLISARILPAQTQEGLARGIRFAAIDCPLAQIQANVGLVNPDKCKAPNVRLLRDGLLDLPPPAC